MIYYKNLTFFCVFSFLLLLTGNGSSQEFIGPHGFLTLEAEISNKDSVGKRGTFDLHHLNMLGSFLLNDKARVFWEIEWEHGTDSDLDEEGGTRVGIVRVERAWFEYAFSNKLKLRLGKFLTPYGIYNEIHDAAPAYDTSILPQSIYGKHENPLGQQQRLYAKFAIGIQALGEFEISGARLLYHFLLSNGRGSNPFEQDDNRDKGIGVRLQSDLPAIGLKIGYSLYSDKNGRANNTRQTSDALDLQFEFKKWHITGEFAHSRLDTDKPSRQKQVANAFYGELAYHLFGRQTVLVRYDIFNPNTRQSNDLEKDLTVGTSVQIFPNVVAKAELHFWKFENPVLKDFTFAIASLAVVF
ncbi:MAG: hypothetical protein ACE5IR_04360 [bacterium]